MLYEEIPFDEIDLYPNDLEQDMEQSEVDWGSFLSEMEQEELDEID